MAGSPVSTSRSSISSRRPVSKASRKGCVARAIKSRHAAMNVRDFEQLRCEALNTHRSIKPKPQSRRITQLQDERNEHHSESNAVATYARRLSNLAPNAAVSTPADEIARILHNIHWASSWEVYVPSRLGHDSKVDVAGRALVLAYQYKFLGDTAKAGPAYRQYGLAITAIRESLDTTDASLIAVGLLCLFESFMQVYSSYQLAHREGVGKILLARHSTEGTGRGPSEVERAAIFGDWNLKYRVPLSRGTVSPFEDPYWLDMEPPRPFWMSEGMIRMQKIGHRSLIRLPRLAAGIRNLQEQSTYDDGLFQASAEETASLADELLSLKDEDAESEMLHRVSVVKTADALDRELVPYSFTFRKFQEFECAMQYWRVRLEVLRCCLVLRQLPLPVHSSHVFQLEEQATTVDMERMVTNIIMSRQYAMGHGMFGRLRLLESFFPCWGVTLSLNKWRGVDVSFLRSWILKRFNDSWSRWGPEVDMESMDEMCQVSIGGPLRGWHVRKHKAENQVVILPTAAER